MSIEGRNFSASKYHSQAEGLYGSPGLAPIARTSVPGSSARA